MTPDAHAETYNAQFFDEISAFSLRSAARIVPIVVDLVAPTSVVDVGCGTGAWLRTFVDHGVDDVLGVDGTWVAVEDLMIDRERFRSADLEHPPSLDRTFDLAMSLEVAEHLPDAAAAGFVDYLTGLAPVVMFGAAAPQQGGHGHVNERWPAYWADHFARRGFRPVDTIRPRVWDDPEVSYWYAQNIVLYVNDDRFADVTPSLPLDDGRPMGLVHPGLAERLAVRINGATLRAIAREAPQLSKRLAQRTAGRIRVRLGG